ncbi:MAG: DUF2865 domain-containing protein [Rhizobiales bacterium]|nr:DUF2865 domain-containing protein [Hyphomicrobiales bacterium]
MTRCRFGTIAGALVAAVVGFAGQTAIPAPAHAQGFFESIFGSFDDGPRNSRRSYAPWDQPERTERYGGREGGERPHYAEPRSSGVLCVRLCDGRHFPIPRSVNGVRLDPAKVCNSLCPAAKTQVFNGGNAEHAVASDGTRYSSLPSAFAYRDRIVADCSCTGQGPGGLAQIDIESDPTLRAGDVVATTSGLTVFKGGRTFPYKSADFTPIDSSRAYADLQRRLGDVRVDVTAVPSTPVQSLANAEPDKATVATKPQRRRVRAQAARTEPERSPLDWFR